jgi:hypothetical protein
MDYNYNAELFARKNGITLVCKTPTYGKHFIGDTEERYIFPCTLRRKGKGSYTFKFGQSIAAGDKEPSMYDVLACLQKSDVGSFYNFCDEFGYSEDSIKAEKIYKAVVKEWENVERLFGDILDELQEIS